MSREGSTPESDALDVDDTPANDGPEIEEGRYVYCIVSTADGNVSDASTLETTGVEGEPVRVVAAEGIGAVVHECDDVYDSADVDEIRRWLVRHQSVVDDAGERFGTPLPFQFDTIIRGGDEAVREWIRSERQSLRSTLDALDGHWEYRIEVVRTDPIDDEALASDDERLAELRAQIDASEQGTAYLLEKRYDDRLQALREERRDALTATVRERLSAHAREVHELDPSPTGSLVDRTENAQTDHVTVCRLTVLAHETDESPLGKQLDDVAERPGIEVRFTGPWPPYTFTPAFGDDESETNRRPDTNRGR